MASKASGGSTIKFNDFLKRFYEGNSLKIPGGSSIKFGDCLKRSYEGIASKA